MAMVSPDPAKDGFEVTPSDTVNLEKPIRALRVGAAGDVTFITSDGRTRTFPTAIAGEVIMCGMTRVLDTGTDATELFGYV
jgi:hypothetical protein